VRERLEEKFEPGALEPPCSRGLAADDEEAQVFLVLG
jgi:hypothetical protein